MVRRLVRSVELTGPGELRFARAASRASSLGLLVIEIERPRVRSDCKI